MSAIPILVVSIGLQLAAAGLSIRLIRVTGRKLSWALIASALVLMAVRRAVPLARALGGDDTAPPDLPNEVVGLALSFLMLVGVARLAPFFRATAHAAEENHRDRQRESAIIDLYQRSPLVADDAFYRELLGEVVALTGSAVGFLHLVSSDQKQIILTAWNEAALETCTAQHDVHYPVDDAGNWADCVRLKRPVVYNDYPTSPNRKGLPAGHAPVKRFMSVPVVEDGAVVAIFGVGNKAEPYDDFDVEQIQALAVDVSRILGARRAERARRESEQKYRTLFEGANDAILLMRADAFVDCNARALALFACDRSRLVGAPPYDFSPPSQPDGRRSDEAALERIRAAQIEGPQFFEWRHCRADGTPFDAEVSLNRMELNGEVMLQAIVRDVSERRRAEEELARHREHLEDLVAARTAELAVAVERAESADHLKSAFLATMSHELRTPLNSIIGFSGILLQGLAGPLNPEQQKQMGMVCSSAEHLLALINDVLDISKIEAGELQIAAAPFDLRAAVEKVVGAARPLAEKKGIAIELSVADGVGAIVSDRRRVEQVLLNLLSNGVKFTERGGVRVEVREAPGRVVLEVSDTGPGIREEDLGKLFKPFSQVDTGLARQHEGTGLGLSICKRLVEMLGGAIWVRSEIGVGSAFGFDLPAGGGERK